MESLKDQEETMKTCEKIMNRILNGEMTPELEQHLRECRECRGLSELAEMIAEQKSAGILPPEDLDKRIMAYARSKQYQLKKPFEFSVFLRRAVMPFAAAVVICVGLVYSFRNQPTQRGKQEFSYYDVSSMNTDILMLSSQIRSSSENLTQTDAFASLNLAGDDIK